METRKAPWAWRGGSGKAWNASQRRDCVNYVEAKWAEASTHTSGGVGYFSE